MNIIVVDDEELAAENLLSLLGRVAPKAQITGFTEPEEAFRYLAEHTVDVAFLDIELGEYIGLTLTKKCRDLCPGVDIVFVTGYSQYMVDALPFQASGYLTKPVRAADLLQVLDRLCRP